MVVGLGGCERRGVGRWIAGGLTLGVLLTSGVTAQGQRSGKQKRPRRETNASRQARIQRTIEATYAHPWEVFGGGGYLRWRSGAATQKNNEVSWAAGANYFLSHKLAIVGDAQGSFGHAKPLKFNPDAAPIANPQINEYFFTGGANYRFYEKEKVALSVQGTGGIAWGIFSSGSPQSYYGPAIGLWQDGIRPAFTVSVNADYNVYPNLAVRFSPTYVGSTFGGQVQNNLGFNAGVLYRFGSRK
ncbi:MAG TPA: hypothetical protein VKV02_00805 [Acidobacteriaceae bacterium]|nr:hypothetical protein [Acidobacteriaceae bacterium]